MKYELHPIQWTPEQIDHLWRYYGTNAAYDNAYFGKHSGKAVLKFISRYLPLRGKRVLDYGAGRGHMLEYMLAAGIACQGLEFSEDSATHIERRVGSHPLFGGVIRATMLPTPIEDDSIDVVLFTEVIEHLTEEQLRPTLQEIYRILRPGGFFIATTPHAENLAATMLHCPECGAIFHQWQHMRSVTVDMMSDLMIDAGFHEIVCKATYFKPSASRFDNLLTDISRFYKRLRGYSPRLPHLVYIGSKSLHPLA